MKLYASLSGHIFIPQYAKIEGYGWILKEGEPTDEGFKWYQENIARQQNKDAKE